MDSAFALGFSRDAVTLLPATRGLLRARRGAAPFVLGATVHNQTPFGLTVLGRARPPASVKPPALPVAAPTCLWPGQYSIAFGIPQCNVLYNSICIWYSIWLTAHLVGMLYANCFVYSLY